MPELPEVETIISNLRPIFQNHRFLGIKIFNENSVSGNPILFEKLMGKKLVEISRRGKFINMFFEDEIVLTVHLRMTGRLIVTPERENLKYERARISFENRNLSFCDLRKFGRIWINSKSDYERATGIIKLGDEPLDKTFALKNFKKLLKGKKGNVKAFLLNQNFIAGIGNIYADESLFYAGIRPHRTVETLQNREVKLLFQGVKCSLIQGIENSGTSFSDFVNAHGEKGGNQELLFVYNRGGKKCLKCQSILMKEKIAGRGSVYCQKCQK